MTTQEIGPEMNRSEDHRPILITGGAGFIGCNLAARFCRMGERVLVFDNLSRPGVGRNLKWLRQSFPERFAYEVADVRDPQAVRKAVRRAKEVFHFAAQVAVTTSLVDPVQDFEANLRGTLNVLEALRREKDPPPLVFPSTNKVYGALKGVSLRKNGSRYEPVEPGVRERGIPEDQPVDFHSPYGCSKGAADHYVIDYARIYGIKSIVFRMSCIYGPRQLGCEDQGWIANFLIRALQERPITFFGDGLQVRDILFVEDLVDAFFLAREHMQVLSGQAFNIGGGPANTVSLVELIQLMRDVKQVKPEIRFDQWRSGDQKYYATDFRKFHAATGWEPRTGVREGVENLFDWLTEHYSLETCQDRIGTA